MRKLPLALALAISLGGVGLADAAGTRGANKAPTRKAAKPAAAKRSKAKSTAKPRAKAKGAKLRRAVAKKPRAQQVSPRQLGMADSLRLGPGSNIVHQYASKRGWNKVTANGASTHVVAVRGGKATYRDQAGKLQKIDFLLEAGTTSRVNLYGVPPNTKVRFEVNVVASTDGGRSFTKRPKQPLTFETVLP